MRHLVIDGNNLLFRCYWSAHKKWHEEKPNMYGYFFLNVIKSYINLFEPDDVIVVWDERKGEQENQRKEIAEDYKANRERNDSVFAFIDDLKEILDRLGVRQLYPLNREGDDIMYWLCAVKFPNKCILVSADTDMYQLVRKDLPGNTVYNPSKKIQVTDIFLKLNYDVEDGREYIVKKALRGDKSDNILGIKGIRKTRVAAVLEAYNRGGMEALKASGVLNNNELAVFMRNMELMSLEKLKKYPGEMDFYESQMGVELRPDKDAFRNKVRQMEYWNIYKNSDKWFTAFQSRNDYLFLFDK